MRKRCALLLALAALIIVGSPATAVIGTIDAVPATTLLLPNFRVDEATGLTTLFEINNASAAPAIAHVTLWTNWSVPTLDFNVFLTGYDVVAINVRDIFVAGTVPATDPFPTTAHGAYSFDNAYPGLPFSLTLCGDQLPLPPLPAALKAHINAWHQGQPSPSSGTCASSPTGYVEGYITIDNVYFCTLDFPETPGYFTGAYRQDNMLWGNYYVVDPSNNFAQGNKLVHVETSPTPLATDYTFYGRYTAGAGFIDQAEGLASLWAARYVNNAAFSGGTDFVVWRDAKQLTNPDRVCGTVPPWYPLNQTQIVVFDEDENPEVVSQNYSGGVQITLIPFPLETQVVEVGGPDLPVTPDSGWIYLNMNTTVVGQNPALNPVEDQNWVAVVMSAEGRYSVGFDALQLDNVTPVGDSSLAILPVPQP